MIAGVLVAIAGLALAFAESIDLGDERAGAGRRGGAGGRAGGRRGREHLDQAARRARSTPSCSTAGRCSAAASLLLVASALGESWGELAWTGESIGSIAYLALIGSAVPFVGLTVLLRHITAQAMSFLAMLLPFGALVFGAVLYDEAITARALGGAALVAAGLLIAQAPRRELGRAATRPRPGSGRATCAPRSGPSWPRRSASSSPDWTTCMVAMPTWPISDAQLGELARHALAGLVPGAAEGLAVVRDVGRGPRR